MRACLVFSVCFVAVLSAVHADTGAVQHGAPQAVHHQQPQPHQQQVVRQSHQLQQQQQVVRQPHQLQQQQPAFGQQQHQQQQQQQQQAAPLPYPLRRQSGSGLERARAAVMGMLESIMNAGARLRRMASERFSTMLRRRSPAAPLKRAYRPQQPQPAAHHQPQQPAHHQPAPQAVPQPQQHQQQ